jgi:hypothetical protein
MARSHSKPLRTDAEFVGMLGDRFKNMQTTSDDSKKNTTPPSCAFSTTSLFFKSARFVTTFSLLLI